MLRFMQVVPELRTVVTNAAAKVGRITFVGNSANVATAALYPSGSHVVVNISQEDGSFLVSDMGQGHLEADLMGGSSTFARTAPQIAERAGVGFDRRAFFIIRVDASRLPGAISTVATCSLEAVQITAFKLSDRRHEDAADRLYSRLVNVFSRAHVVRDAEIVGASNTAWHVSNLVRIEGHTAAFEPVTSHPNSVAAAVTKFFDISQLDNAPARVAVVRKKENLGTRLGVLSSAAKVVEEDVPDDTYKGILQAA